MSLSEVTIEGTLKPDGTLELDKKPNLPAGRVQVVLRQQAGVRPDTADAFLQRMQAIWAMQADSGYVPRSVEEVEAERELVREEWEERMRRIEQIQLEAEAKAKKKARKAADDRLS